MTKNIKRKIIPVLNVLWDAALITASEKEIGPFRKQCAPNTKRWGPSESWR